MISPRRSLLRSLIAIAVGIGCLIALLVVPDRPDRTGVLVALGFVGFIATIFGALTLWWARAALRVERSLIQRRDVIAEWTVKRDTWSQFVVLNRTFSLNQVTVPSNIPSAGIPVIFSASGMLIGDQVETFNRTSNEDGVVRHWGGDWTVTKASLGGDNPCCLYLYAGMRGNHGAPTFVNLIVPVPVEAIPAARRVLDYFLGAIAQATP